MGRVCRHGAGAAGGSRTAAARLTDAAFAATAASQRIAGFGLERKTPGGSASAFSKPLCENLREKTGRRPDWRCGTGPPSPTAARRPRSPEKWSGRRSRGLPPRQSPVTAAGRPAGCGQRRSSCSAAAPLAGACSASPTSLMYLTNRPRIWGSVS